MMPKVSREKGASRKKRAVDSVVSMDAMDFMAPAILPEPAPQPDREEGVNPSRQARSGIGVRNECLPTLKRHWP